MTQAPQYQLFDPSQAKWLARFPTKGGAPASWTTARSEAVKFKLDDLTGLSMDGYWEYAATCKCVLETYTPSYVTLEDDQGVSGRWTCEECGYEDHEHPMPPDMDAFKKNLKLREGRLGRNHGYKCPCCGVMAFLPNEVK